MEIKLARTEINKTPKSVDLEKLEAEVVKNSQKIFYLDRENSDSNLLELVNFFEDKGYSVYHRRVKYGLSENEFMHEVHIL